MFIENHNTTLSDQSILELTFIRSKNVQVYPCGRRRSNSIDIDGKSETLDSYYIPFDPEARLNTEANNRRYSGLNGYTQTYVHSWDETSKLLTLSMAGYLFRITLDDGYETKQKFSEGIVGTSSNATKIYANILVEDVTLFSSNKIKEYKSAILRNQSTDGETPLAIETLDLIKSASPETYTNAFLNNANNYYFSGLSFSTEPLAGVDTSSAYSEKHIAATDNTPEQYVVSLCILSRNSTADSWTMHQQALLPEIKHGVDENSVVINKLYATSIVNSNNIPIPSLQVVKSGSKYQLQFDSADGLYN